MEKELNENVIEEVKEEKKGLFDRFKRPKTEAEDVEATEEKPKKSKKGLVKKGLALGAVALTGFGLGCLLSKKSNSDDENDVEVKIDSDDSDNESTEVENA